MNWYKQAQQVISGPYKETGVSYLDIGHEDRGAGFEQPKIIWALINGRIKTVEEDSDNPTHMEAFPNLDSYKAYTGRYEPDRNLISIFIPMSQKSQRMRREVPASVMRLLRAAFPLAEKVYIFT